MKLKKLKKLITMNDKFYIKHVFYDNVYLDCNDDTTSNIKNAIYFSSYNDALIYRNELAYTGLFEIVSIHET